VAYRQARDAAEVLCNCSIARLPIRRRRRTAASPLADLGAAHPGAWVTLVSHVGPIKVLLCTALAVPLTAARRLFLDPGTLSVIDWGESPVMRLYNAHGHLGWREARWMRQ
jgi:broad specificity phosphatase PhoE